MALGWFCDRVDSRCLPGASGCLGIGGMGDFVFPLPFVSRGCVNLRENWLFDLAT